MSLTSRALAAGGASLCVLAITSTAPAGADVTAPVTAQSNLASPAGNLPTAVRYPDATFNGASAVLPDGRFITPAGRTEQVRQQPQSVLLSHDGTRLYVSSESYDDSVPDHPPRYFTVLDTATMQKVEVEDDALSQGLAESADGSTLYVAEGQSDSLGVFHRTPGTNGHIGTITKVADFPLAASSGKAVDYPWGLALSPDGTKAYVAGYGGDVLITVATATGSVLSRTPTGAYPYDVVLSPDGTKAYVSNWGIYNSDAALGYSSPIDPPPISYGGSYNTENSDSVWSYSLPASGAAPTVLTATKIGHDLNGGDVLGGSSPSGIGLSPDGRTLAVTSSNDDEVQLLDVTTTVPSSEAPSTVPPNVPSHPTSTIDLRAVTGSAAVPAPSGAQPNAVAWAADGSALFVAEGERNDVAVVDPAKVAPDSKLTQLQGSVTGGQVGSMPGPNRAAVTGRIPTAWYPGALAVSSTDSDLWVGDVRGFGTGPSGLGDPDIKDRQTGAVQDIPISAACGSLPSLTATSDRDNGLAAPTATSGSNGDGSVVPATYGSGPSAKIKHVFLIIKENKTFDDELGDLGAKAETDPSLVRYGKAITPNLHGIVGQYATSDNFYAPIETSTQGHNNLDEGQVSEFTDKVTPTAYIGKFPYGSYDTLPENLPEGGFIWNNAARNGVRSTVYGEGLYVVGVAPAALGAAGTQPAPTQLPAAAQHDGLITFDQAYPSQVDYSTLGHGPQKPALNAAGYYYNDEGRYSEFSSAGGQGLVSQLNVMILFDDHTSGDLPGAMSPEDNVAENDHALGETIDTITHSSYWPSSAIFVTEDDTQGGEDHVDQHRDLLEVISPYAKQGYVSHVHTSFESLDKTIDLILGLPPTSLQEMTSTSLADMFTSTPAVANTYSHVPDPVFPFTNPTPAASPNAALARAAQLSLAAGHQIDRGGALFDEALRLDRIGEAEAGDPNVVTTPGTVHHDLPAGLPTPVAPLPTASLSAFHAGASPTAGPVAACLAAAPGPGPALGESRRPATLAGALAAAVGLGWYGRRRLTGRRLAEGR